MYDPFIPVLVIGGVALVASVLLFFVPDPVDQVLPQTIEDGENFARNQSLCFCPMFSTRNLVTSEASKEEREVATTSDASAKSVVGDNFLSTAQREKPQQECHL